MVSRNEARLSLNGNNAYIFISGEDPKVDDPKVAILEKTTYNDITAESSRRRSSSCSSSLNVDKTNMAKQTTKKMFENKNKGVTSQTSMSSFLNSGSKIGSTVSANHASTSAKTSKYCKKSKSFEPDLYKL